MLRARYIEGFEKITGQNLTNFFLLFDDFIAQQNQRIINYYTGKTDEIDPNIFEQLNYLIDQAQSIQASFDQNENAFDNYGYWEITIFVDDIYRKLLTIKNYPRFLRSSRFQKNYNGQVSFDYVLGEQETLADVANYRLNSSDPLNDDMRIALENSLSEEDYTVQGGNYLQLSQKTRNPINVQSIIDVTIGERLLGQDIDKKLTFINNDLKVLSYEKTPEQSLNILVSLLKGDIPEYPNLGMEPKLIGSNRGSIFYASLIRDVNSAIATDDTIEVFQIAQVVPEEDRLRIDYKYQTLYGSVYHSTTLL